MNKTPRYGLIPKTTKEQILQNNYRNGNGKKTTGLRLNKKFQNLILFFSKGLRNEIRKTSQPSTST